MDGMNNGGTGNGDGTQAPNPMSTPPASPAPTGMDMPGSTPPAQPGGGMPGEMPPAGGPTEPSTGTGETGPTNPTGGPTV